MENELSDLIKYNKYNSYYGILFGILLSAGGVYLIYSGNIGYGIAGIIMGVVLIVLSIMEKKEYKDNINAIKANGEMPALLSDFRGGSRAFNGKLIAGQYFLIGEKTGSIIKYDDIAQVYETIHKTNYIEDGRTITVVTKDNKKKDLCKIKIWGKSKDELTQFFEYIKSRNPEIVLGYNEKQ